MKPEACVKFPWEELHSIKFVPLESSFKILELFYEGIHFLFFVYVLFIKYVFIILYCYISSSFP